MVRPLYKRAVKGARNRTGTYVKETHESQRNARKKKFMLRSLNKFNFPYYFCERIAKPYPDGPVDQRDSFGVQLCDNFILGIAFSS